MLPQYDKYFDDRVRRDAVFPLLSRERVAFIQEFLRPPPSWRSDAHAFMISNLHNMLLAPLAEAGGAASPTDTYVFRQTIDPSELYEALRADIGAIVALSAAISQVRNRDYVSATTVAIALGQLAPTLRTTSFQVWGPRTQEG